MTTLRRRRAIRLTLAAGVAAVCLVAAEFVARTMPAAEPLGRVAFESTDGRAVATLQEAAALGLVVPVPGPTPRPRHMFAPGQRFFLCYGDAAREGRGWLDERGRVPVRINQHGLRERDEIGTEKPAGQRRVVCIGDSFTFGWGVREEDGWVRLLERDLRARDDGVRTVNCGAAGALCVDEYWWGLQHRFSAFAPDAVVVTLCLNDLVPSSGLCVIGPTPAPTGLRLLDLLRAAVARDPLDLDPAVDWVGILLNLPQGDGEKAGLYGPDKPFAAMWSQGVPQQSLREMRSWCAERRVPLLVVLWPFLQGLRSDQTYPFARLHDLVAEQCRRDGIPLLDLLPTLRGRDAATLWVTPADMHANSTAHRLAAPAIARFVAEHWK
jgi:lysophospholipase L1-like esterase